MSDLILDPSYGPPADPAAATTPADIIKDSNTDNFMADVIEASQSVPVIVDFWSPSCEPCKTLGPLLEKLVKRAGGLVKMVKINVDENQPLAAQLRVQSVPTVFAFKDGRPATGFAGAQPESQLQSFIDQLIGDAKPPIAAAMEQATALLKAGEGVAAEEIFTAVLAQDDSFLPALAGMIRAIAAQGEFDRARDIIGALDTKTLANAEIGQAVSALELAEQGALTNTGELADLQAKVDADAKDLAAKFDLAQALLAAGRPQDAIDNLLDIVAQDRAWNEEAGRKQLIKIFDALGPTDPLTVEARKRLSAVLFS